MLGNGEGVSVPTLSPGQKQNKKTKVKGKCIGIGAIVSKKA